MSSPVNELSQNTNASEMGNLLENDKFGMLSVLSFSNGETIYDGVTDATTAIQDAFDMINTLGKGKVFFPSGNYLVSANASTGVVFTVYDNTEIIMGPNVTITLQANNLSSYKIFNLTDKDNIKIIGGTIIGDRDTHTGVTGEFGHGICILDCTNITLLDVTVQDCWGDGTYIGGNTTPTYDVVMDRCTLHNNRRDNLSLPNVVRFKATNCTFDDANGTSPQGCVVIEPNGTSDRVQYIHFDNCLFKDNDSAFAFQCADDNNPDLRYDLTVTNCTFVDCQGGIAAYANGLNISNNTFINISPVNSAFQCISIGGLYSYNVNVIGNTFVDCDNVCIKVSGGTKVNVIGNNSSGSSTKDFIQLLGGSGICSNNSCEDFGAFGIDVYDASNWTISENVLKGSINGGDSNRSGIYLDGNSDNNKLFGNTIIDIGGTNTLKYGIRVASNTCNSNIIANNDVVGVGSTAGISDSGTGTIIDFNRMKSGAWTQTPD